MSELRHWWSADPKRRILAHTTPLRTRSIYLGLVGGLETAALAFGPLISGALETRSSWRLGFWITVPLVGIAAALVLLSTKSLRRSENAHYTSKEALRRIDWTGFGINIPMTLCLVMALQWAGTLYPWSNWRIILLLVLAAMSFMAFIVVEHRGGNSSMVPLSMLRRRSVAFAGLITFSNFAHLAITGYYVGHLQPVKSAC